MIYFTPCGDEITSTTSSDCAIFINPCLSKSTLASLNPADLEPEDIQQALEYAAWLTQEEVVAG